MYGDFWINSHAKFVNDPVKSWIRVCDPSSEEIDLVIYGLLLEYANEDSGVAGKAISQAIEENNVKKAINAHAWFMNVDGEDMTKFDLDYLRKAWFDEEADADEEDDEDDSDFIDLLDHPQAYNSFIDFLNLILEHPQAFINWRNSKELKPFEEFAKDDDPNSEENQMLKMYMGILSAGALEELREK